MFFCGVEARWCVCFCVGIAWIHRVCVCVPCARKHDLHCVFCTILDRPRSGLRLRDLLPFHTCHAMCRASLTIQASMLLDMHYITECVPSLTTFSSILLVVVYPRLASRIFLCWEGGEGKGKKQNPVFVRNATVRYVSRVG